MKRISLGALTVAFLFLFSQIPANAISLEKLEEDSFFHEEGCIHFAWVDETVTEAEKEKFEVMAKELLTQIAQEGMNGAILSEGDFSPDESYFRNVEDVLSAIDSIHYKGVFRFYAYNCFSCYTVLITTGVYGCRYERYSFYQCKTPGHSSDCLIMEYDGAFTGLIH